MIPDTLTINRSNLLMLGAILNDTYQPTIRAGIICILAEHGFSLEDIGDLRKEARWEAESIRQSKRGTFEKEC